VDKLIVLESSVGVSDSRNGAPIPPPPGVPGNFPSSIPPTRTFSLVDDNSGRELTISSVGKQPVSSGAVPTFAVPFIATNMATAFQMNSYTPYTGQTEWWLQLRDEFILPRGAVLRIRSTTLDGEVKPQDFGFSVALVGYKVFG
jgi:hypothetical protein